MTSFEQGLSFPPAIILGRILFDKQAKVGYVTVKKTCRNVGITDKPNEVTVPAYYLLNSSTPIAYVVKQAHCGLNGIFRKNIFKNPHVRPM